MADVRRWAALADEFDECEAAAALWATADVLGPANESWTAAVPRALNFLLLGRVGDAIRCLDALDASPAEQPDTGAADAVRAAAGDPAAWGRLLNHAAQAPSLLLFYLVAAAAECRGDLDTADQAWLTIRDRAARRTGLVLSRAAVAEITAVRGADDPAERAAAIYRAAVALTTPPDRFARDPRWAQDALRRLDSRGDPGAARILVETLQALGPGLSGPLDAELRRRVPHAGMLRYRAAVGGGLLFSLAFAWLGVIWLGATVLVSRGVQRRVRVPGLDLPDSRAWRMLRPFRAGPLFERDVAGLNGWAALVIGVLAAALAIPVAALATPTDASELVVASIWLMALVVVPVGVILGVNSGWRAWQVQRRRDRARAAAAATVRVAVRCQCWSIDRMVDAAAAAYLREHLILLPFGDELQAVTVVSDLGHWLGECPASGLRWLGFQTTSQQAIVLVRGAARSAETEVHAD